MNTFWQKGISFESYLSNNAQKIRSLNKETAQKYKTAYDKSEYLRKNYVPNKKQLKKLEEKAFRGQLLIIAEGWCGDCSQIIPVIAKYFEERNSVKIVYRDESTNLMRQFRTNGNEAIPIIIILDQENKITGYWGPRTKRGTEILLKHKKNIDKFSKEDFLAELHQYYDSNKGVDIIDELLLIL